MGKLSDNVLLVDNVCVSLALQGLMILEPLTLIEDFLRIAAFFAKGITLHYSEYRKIHAC